MFCVIQSPDIPEHLQRLRHIYTCLLRLHTLFIDGKIFSLFHVWFVRGIKRNFSFSLYFLHLTIIWSNHLYLKVIYKSYSLVLLISLGFLLETSILFSWKHKVLSLEAYYPLPRYCCYTIKESSLQTYFLIYKMFTEARTEWCWGVDLTHSLVTCLALALLCSWIWQFS